MKLGANDGGACSFFSLLHQVSLKFKWQEQNKNKKKKTATLSLTSIIEGSAIDEDLVSNIKN